MWLCSPTSDSPSDLSTRRTASARRSRQREAELLVLVRGGDELVGVRLDADGQPDHHRPRRRRARGRSRPAGRSRGTSRAPPARRPPRPRRRARRTTCCCRATRSARPGTPRAARWPARRRCRRPARGPPRRPSAPPRCRGTPWPRSAPTTAPNAAANSCARDAEVGLVDHEQRRAVGARRGRARRRPRSRPTPDAAADGVARPHGGRERVQLGGAGGARPGRLGRGEIPACSGPAGCALTAPPRARDRLGTSAVTSAPAR